MPTTTLQGLADCAYIISGSMKYRSTSVAKTYIFLSFFIALILFWPISWSNFHLLIFTASINSEEVINLAPILPSVDIAIFISSNLAVILRISSVIYASSSLATFKTTLPLITIIFFYKQLVGTYFLNTFKDQ